MSRVYWTALLRHSLPCSKFGFEDLRCWGKDVIITIMIVYITMAVSTIKITVVIVMAVIMVVIIMMVVISIMVVFFFPNA